MSRTYTLLRKQVLPVSIEHAWAFFSDPQNLSSITPDNMGFKVISKNQGANIYAGQVIEYKVSPLLGISFYWMTEITHVNEGKYFVDEQRFGPYSLWHHEHHFKAVEGGVEMTDLVHYKLPFWFLGDIAHALFVKKKLKEIFDFRYEVVGRVLGESKK